MAWKDSPKRHKHESGAQSQPQSNHRNLRSFAGGFFMTWAIKKPITTAFDPIALSIIISHGIIMIININLYS